MRRKRRLKNEINVTPFVDVMLVLLIVFMISSSMMITGIVTDVPQTKSKGLNIKQKTLLIEIDREGNIYLEEDKIILDNLIKNLKLVYKRNKNIQIFLRGSDKANYGKVINIMSLLNEIGFEKISLITKPE